MTTSRGKKKDGHFVLFYSWQSDLPDETNRRLIREAPLNAVVRNGRLVLDAQAVLASPGAKRNS